MGEYKNSKIVGLLGTIAIHTLIVLLLWLLFIRSSQNTEESGIPVMLGDQLLSNGDTESYTLTKIDIYSKPTTSPNKPGAAPDIDEEALLTQDKEETVAIKEPKKTKKKDTPQKENKKQTSSPKEESTSSQKEITPKKSEEEIRLEKEHALAEATAKNVAGAFGKGNTMASKGNSDKSNPGNQGVITGNSSNGQMTGNGGYGTYDLGGRGLAGNGQLPSPVYTIQDEGRVVVSITVNPAGNVISTSINKKTNTVNQALRKAAEEAAKKAKFQAISGVENQHGTITYYFKLK